MLFQRFAFLISYTYYWQVCFVLVQVPVDEPIKEIKEVLIKQADELEKVLLEKINVIENLIESTKKTTSMMQHEATNSGNKDLNDAGFIGGCTRASIIDKPNNQNMLATHNVIHRKLSSIDRPLIANENASLLQVNVRHRKLSTAGIQFANQNTLFSPDANISRRKTSNNDKPIDVILNMPPSHSHKNHN